MISLETARAILDQARWAPSGDNTQPWRFEIVSPTHIIVHGFDTREHCVYDLDGHSSQLAIGGLLESIRIAATCHGLRARFVRRDDAPETQPSFDVHLRAESGLPPEQLFACLQSRSVQRRALRARALQPDEKAKLENSVGAGYRVHWLEGLQNRWRAARLMWLNAKLRLTIPEAFAVHRSIIEWDARFSEDRIPEQALGVNWLSARLMRFAMGSWPRIQFINRWLAGTFVPRIEMDLIPSLACGAHFLIAAPSPCARIDDYIAAGRTMQRFWLTATSLGLQLQPEMTPLIFARYAREGRRFSTFNGAQSAAQQIAERVEGLFGAEPAARAVFMGRIGEGPPAKARSVRLPLQRLMVPVRVDSTQQQEAR